MSKEIDNEIDDILTPAEQEELELQLNDAFDVVLAVSQELQAAKEKGIEAKGKAESIQTGFFKSKNKAIDGLKDAVITNADTTLATLEVVDQVSENQKKMSDACSEFIKLGAVDLANNRAVVEFIEKTMQGGANQTLTEETQAQLIGVIKELKQKEDLLLKQKKQGERINEHENRLVKMEAQATELVQELECSRETEKRHDIAINYHHKKGKERDERLSAGEKHDQEQDEELDSLRQKNIEQDKRLEKGDKADQEQDKRLDAGDKKDIEQDRRLDAGDERDREQDALLEKQKATDKRHDEQLASHEKSLSELEERIKNLESEIAYIKDQKPTHLYIALCAVLGIIGIILGILALIL